MQWHEFDGIYCVSDHGRVYSTVADKFIALCVHTGGYLKVSLHVNGKNYNRYAHRMVAESFLPDWDRELQVNHIDGNKKNNHVGNLEMVTPSQNMSHAHHSKIGGAHHLHKGGKHNHARPVLQFTKDGEFIAKYNSTYQAQCATGVSSGNLSGVATGNRKSAGGYIWKWEETVDDSRKYTAI